MDNLESSPANDGIHEHMLVLYTAARFTHKDKVRKARRNLAINREMEKSSSRMRRP